MKIKFVGTGDIWNKSNSACYLIDDVILLDMPNGAMKAMSKQNVNIKKIKHVLITHFHGDHYFDVPFYLLMQKNLKKKGEVTFYLHRSGKRRFRKLFYLAFPYSIFNVLKKCKIHFSYKRKFMLIGYQVEKIKVKHGHMKKAYAYLFKKDNLCIGFTGDCAYSKEIELLAKNCDLLVCDTTYEKGDNKHMGINNLLTLSEKYPLCTFVASHLSKTTQKLLTNNKYHNIIVPKDGQVINVE